MEKFNFFAPIQTFEKGKDSEGSEIYKVGGLISDSSEDADNEYLDYNGFDFSDFNFINWNHGKEPKDIIGEPDNWKIVPGKGVYMEGTIYPDSEVGHQAVKLMKTLQKSKKGNKLGWSIEGQVIERDLVNRNKVTKAKITAVALCPFPKNGNTFADLIQKGFTGKGVFQESTELDYGQDEGTTKNIIDTEDDEGNKICVDKEGNIKIDKAQSTENSGALAKEDLEDDTKVNLQKAIVTVAKAHKEGKIGDEQLRKALKYKKFL